MNQWMIDNIAFIFCGFGLLVMFGTLAILNIAESDTDRVRDRLDDWYERLIVKIGNKVDIESFTMEQKERKIGLWELQLYLNEVREHAGLAPMQEYTVSIPRTAYDHNQERLNRVKDIFEKQKQREEEEEQALRAVDV